MKTAYYVFSQAPDNLLCRQNLIECSQVSEVGVFFSLPFPRLRNRGSEKGSDCPGSQAND